MNTIQLDDQQSAYVLRLLKSAVESAPSAEGREIGMSIAYQIRDQKRAQVPALIGFTVVGETGAFAEAGGKPLLFELREAQAAALSAAALSTAGATFRPLVCDYEAMRPQCALYADIRQ